MASDSAWPAHTEVAPWASARTAHLASLSAGVVGAGDSGSAGAGDSRIYNFHGMTATSSGQKLARIFAGRELVDSAQTITDSSSAVSEPAQIPAINVPFLSPQIKPVGYQTGLGDKPMSHEEQEAANRARREEEAQRPPVLGANQPTQGPSSQPANNSAPQPNPVQQQNPQQNANPAPASTVAPNNGGQPQPNAATPPADNSQPPQPAANAPQQPVAPADEHIFGLPDTTGHKEGDTWEEVLPNGIRRVNTIPYGNGTATVDQVIYNANGTTTWGRVVSNGQGGYQRWNNDSTGRASYYNSGNGDSYGEGQSFLPGSSTSGAPDREFVASPDWARTGTTAYDADGNPIGMDFGTRNKDGLYDNTYRDLHGNETFTRTKANPNGGVDSVLVGQVDNTGHGWIVDEQDRRWDVYVDDNGNSARKRIDPTTGWRSFVYKDGDNTKSETLDTSGHLMEGWTYGPDNTLLSSWVREGDTVIRGELGKDGKFEYTFRDLDKRRHGDLTYLPDGGYRMKYSDGEMFEFDKSGKQTTHWSPPRITPQEMNKEFGKSIGKAILNTAVGLGAMTGINDVFNAIGKVSGRYSNILPTKKETEEGIAQAADSLTAAVKQFYNKSFTEFVNYGAGNQGFGTTLMNIAPSYINVFNEESKIIIGTDWKELPNNPGAVLGNATFGIGSFFLPVKAPGLPKHLPLGAIDASGQVGKTAAAALRSADRFGNLGRILGDPLATAESSLLPSRVPSWMSDAAAKTAGALDRVPQRLGNWWAGTDARITEIIQETFGPLNGAGDLVALGPQLRGLTGREPMRPNVFNADTGAGLARADGSTPSVVSKGPGVPDAPKQLPPSTFRKLPDGTEIELKTRTLDDGTTIEMVANRPLAEFDHTRGYVDGLPSPVKNADGSWTINLRMHEGWKEADFIVKAEYLQELGDTGKLIKTRAPKRTKKVNSWRSAKEREIFYNAKSQADLDARLKELDSEQIDHAHDLQLRGKDEHLNMWGIDAATNHGMGGQIYSQLLQVLDRGASIRINIIR